GQVEPLEQPLDAAVLAEGAVQGGEDGVGAEQPAAGDQLDRAAAGAPAALAADPHLDHLVPGVAEAPRHRRAGAQRDLVLGGAAAREHRHLHPSSPSSSTGAACLPTVIVTVSPGSASVPGGGNWSVTRPT